MEQNLVTFLILILISSIIKCQNPNPVDSYPNKFDLEPSESFVLYWKHDQTDIKFEIHYKNSSRWILFGIQTDNYSDLVAGWVNDDGTGHFSDRKLTNQNVLSTDDKQDWLIEDAFSKNNYRILIFSRKIKQPCGAASSDDLDLQTGVNRIVYAFGNQVDNNEGKLLDFSSVKVNTQITLLNPSGTYNCETIKPRGEFTSQPLGTYTNYIDLIDEGIYRFYWSFTLSDLTGEIHVKTNGWVGFGLSPNGGMSNSDVIVGWINDGNGAVNFTDRYNLNGQSIIDKNQNWKLLGSAQKNGYTIFRFTRPLILCDSDDRKIEAGSPYVIFSYGLTDPPVNGDITYHGSRRGSKTVNLISSISPTESTIKDFEIIEFSISNVILPRDETYYYAKAFQIPTNLTQKRHIIKYEFVLPKINTKNIHHLLIYECKPTYDGTPAILPGDSNRNQAKHQNCPTITLGWAIGGDTIIWFPKDTGYPIGGDTDYKYIVPEIHYDNPELKIGFIENFKIRYYMTKSLQTNELGVLSIGSETGPFSLELPPRLEKIGVNSYCFNDCITKSMTTPDITVVSAIPHTHLAGNEVWTKIIRKGVDIGYLFRNKYYDFNYQNSYNLNPPVKITKDDALHTYCGYQTMSRDKFTTAGISTKDEMCYQFLTYYPRRANFKGCLSSIHLSEINNLLQNLNDTGLAKIKAYDKSTYGGIYTAFFNDFLPNNNVLSKEIAKKFIDLYNNTKFMMNCNQNYDFIKLYDQLKASNQYVEKDACTPGNNNNNNNSNNIFTNIINSIINFFINLFK